jgi:hypothetical protein
MLTLLVVPSFYDSIEIARERAGLKFRARAAYFNPVVAFLLTFGEFLATIYFIRFFYRAGRALMGMATPGEHPVERAARLTGFPVPAGFVARPKRWQHPNFRRDDVASTPPPMTPDPGAIEAPTSTLRWKPIKAS